MNKTIIKLLIILLFLSFSCKEEFDYTTNKFLTLRKTDTIKIALPHTVSNPISNTYGYWNYNNKYLGFLSNPDGNNIDLDIYEKDKKKWIKVPLQIDGNNKVYSAGSFVFSNNNTFYYFPIIIPKILKINFEGQVVESFDYSEQYLHAISTLVKNQKVMQSVNKIGFNTSEFLNTDDKETYLSARNYTLFDFSTSKSKHIIKYPEEFHGESWSPNDAYGEVIPYGDKLVHSFSKSNYLYIYDKEGTFERKVFAGSDKIESASPLKIKNQNSMVSLINTENNGYYSSLVYDKWRKLFYRIGVFYDTSQKAKNFEELSKNRNKRTIVILTLNEKFEILGEDTFPNSSKVHKGFYFVDKNGFYIGMHSNKENEINFLSFVNN